MGLFSKFIAKIKGTNDFAPSDWKELEEELLLSDLGPSLTKAFLEQARKVKSENAQEALSQILSTHLSTKDRGPILGQETTVILVVGVNGTGKTTSVAKLAANLKKSGKNVVMAAGDTFRAAAVEQLQTWGMRIGVEVVSGKANGDPASVAFDAATKATAEHFEILIIDTAGRLHTKSNLMEELTKVRRVVEKVTPIDEVLFVLDGTTGQNGITQARTFMDAVALTGLIVTKLDGSTKGGIALATERALKITVKLIGTGEGEGDLEIFDPATYVSNLLTQP